MAEVYDAVTDLSMAVDTAMGIVDQGDESTLEALFLAAPQLSQVPFVTPFLIAVRAVLTGAEPAQEMSDLIDSAAEKGNDTQRAAGVARLRRLARRRPEHARALNGLADILAEATANAAATPPSS